MVTISSIVNVHGVNADDILNFMLNCTDEEYQRWWPGTHIAFHTIQRFDHQIGNIVYFDEYIGKKHLVFKGMITDHIPGKKIIWQLIKGWRLPVFVMLETQQQRDYLQITHTLAIGFNGLGRLFDPLIRLFVTKKFCQALDAHAQAEFPMLAQRLIEKRKDELTSSNIPAATI